MDVYLDDIAIYSETLELHLSASKLKFLCSEIKILGRIVDDQGIRMDPDKVDNVLNWKVPTNRELLRGFLGSVGYLVDDIATICIPMGVLSSLTGTEVSFCASTTVFHLTIQRVLHASGLLPMDPMVGLPA